MLAGIENVRDDQVLVRHFVDDLVSPFGYRSVVPWLIGQVFLCGVFLRKVAQASGQMNQGLLDVPGGTDGVFSNVVVDKVKAFLCPGVSTNRKLLFLYQLSTSFSRSSWVM